MSRRAWRDAALATVLLAVAVWIGSRGGRDLDPALLGYLGATLAATFALAWRTSAFWRRPPSAFYARALVRALRQRRRMMLGAAARDVGAQRFIAARGRLRWLAHLALALGTLASFAITLPLVFGWVHFVAEGEHAYRPVVFGFALAPFALDGIAAWLVFHVLALAGAAVAVGATYFLAHRTRTRRLPGASDSAEIVPLALLLAVALSGLALPISRTQTSVFAAAASLHEVAVIVLLVALPFSKLGHVLLRPLQLGVRAVRAPGVEWTACAGCGAPLAPRAQAAAVEVLLAARGVHPGAHLRRCPSCRRRDVAAAQTRLVAARFHPELVRTRVAAWARAVLGRAA